MSYAAAAAKGPKQSPEEAYVKPVFIAKLQSVLHKMAYRRLLEHEDNDLCDIFLWRERELFASLIASTIRKQFARANIPRPNSRAPPPPQVAHEEASIGSLVDVDSPHVASVSSDYSGKTQTQVEREEREAEDAEREAREKFNEVSEEASQKYEKGKKEASEKGKELKREASAKGKEVEADAKVVGHDISEASKDAKHDLSEKAKVARQKAKEAGHEANEKAKIAGQKTKEAAHDANERAQEAGHELNENRDNPVVIANALIIGLGSAFVGFGAYKKYQAGELNWQVGGFWAGAIGLFALGDYYMSQWIPFQEQIPTQVDAACYERRGVCTERLSVWPVVESTFQIWSLFRGLYSSRRRVLPLYLVVYLILGNKEIVFVVYDLEDIEPVLSGSDRVAREFCLVMPPTEPTVTLTPLNMKIEDRLTSPLMGKYSYIPL
ncbi:hypothetical protein MMC15_004461 [Xylographa vitiligo]|nr:hypothetical protein [Xylographa vitiligo]